MKIAVVCRDTRGEVQPYAALAIGLSGAGHNVRAIAPANLTHLFSNAGIAVTALSGDNELDRLATDGVAEMSGRERMKLQRRELPRQIRVWTTEVLAACDDADLITKAAVGTESG